MTGTIDAYVRDAVLGAVRDAVLGALGVNLRGSPADRLRTVSELNKITGGQAPENGGAPWKEPLRRLSSLLLDTVGAEAAREYAKGGVEVQEDGFTTSISPKPMAISKLEDGLAMIKLEKALRFEIVKHDGIGWYCAKCRENNQGDAEEKYDNVKHLSPHCPLYKDQQEQT